MKWSALCLLTLLFSVVGCGTPSLLITPVSSRATLAEETVRAGQGWSRSKVVILEVEGMLINARSGGFLQPSENKLSLFVQQLEKAAADKSVKAVVLRINSPGGTVTTSDTMYQALVAFRSATGKKVVASTQELAASGAYYLACGADEIVVHPTSVVGSIGVIFNNIDFVGTMGKLGVRATTIKSGPMKDMGSPFHTPTPEQQKVMQGIVDAYYSRFVDTVVKNRSIAADDVAVATDGRVFTGEQAIALGLADRAGTLEDAVARAQELAGITNAQIVLYRRPFGYTGSIYASAHDNVPQSHVLTLDLPGMNVLPSGFYYLWQP